MMKVEDLKLQNNEGETALWLAIASTDKMVDVLLKRNKDLLKIRTKGSLPFLCALWSGHNDVVECIYSMTNIADEEWKDSDKKSILNSCIAAGLFDIALEIINHCKTKGTLMTIGTEVLRYLAYKPAAFDEKVRSFFRRLVLRILPGPGNFENSTGVKIVRCIWSETVKQNLQKHEDILKTIAGDSEEKEGLLFTAARLGNYKFIAELLKLYPEIAWERDHNNYTIFHVAVIHRHENVYNLLYELGLRKLGTLDKNKDNILHLAAKKPAQSRLNVVSGAALQMQRELLWFEEVKTRVNSTDRRKWNEEKKSPQALFSEQHADLMEKGEKWMKNTANHCMVVAALIATIMFAAAFTLPGGNNGDTGHPILLKKSAFVVFVVADAVSLCTSSASILMFLAILTSRYAEKDFLVSLPVKLMVGLVTLFLSIVTMMIAFSASFFLLYAESMKWIPVSIAALAGVPVVLFALLQSRLLFDVINSTFNSRHLFRPKNRMI
ncbi:ankyrin repeat-containing protein ITN1-like isoform X1 [Daucus carota subsp. sativus]|nr:PREDICTED: ankyrin repeat-containing protein At3g12360-like isoform X1 [Daucus carota subsp. sativus]